MDFKSIVKEYESKIMEDLFGLLSIDSVRTKGTKDAPVGQGPKDALLYMLSLAERDGMTTKVVENLAGHIELGQGEDLFGILGHVDVVPAGSGWDTDPFKPEIKDGYIVARGVQDDKGPTIAAYYAMKILKDLDLELNQRVRLIIGTDEESDWQCTEAYFKQEEMPSAGFAPDAEFPLIYGEKGMTTFDLVLDSDIKPLGDHVLLSFDSGERYNMVPESATAVLKSTHVEDIVSAYENYLKNTGEKGESSVQNDEVTLTIYGKSAHGSTPQEGVNAAMLMINFLKTITIDDRALKFIAFGDHFIVDNYDAKQFGIDYTHSEMGSSSVNTGVVKYAYDDSSYYGVNLRYPVGLDFKAALEEFKKKLDIHHFEVENLTHMVPHYVDKNDPLVKTLLASYRKYTDDDTEPFTIGGGTYARVMERGVAFGAMFKDSLDTMHQKNERMKVEELLLATTIYLEALFRILVRGGNNEN